MFMPQTVLKTYYDGLEEGKILGLKCPKCGNVEWPPVPTCNECGSTDMDWVEIQGKVTVESFQPVTPAIVVGPVRNFLPWYLFEGRLAEGTPVSGMLFGVTEENEQELRAKLPFAASAKLLQLDGFKTVGWQVDEQ
jgi:hypothetical protein